MSQRDEIFATFGPKLLEAFMRLIRDEINILRSEHGLPDRTNDQIYDQITNHHSGLPDYDWMDYEL